MVMIRKPPQLVAAFLANTILIDGSRDWRLNSFFFWRVVALCGARAPIDAKDGNTQNKRQTKRNTHKTQCTQTAYAATHIHDHIHLSSACGKVRLQARLLGTSVPFALAFVLFVLFCKSIKWWHVTCIWSIYVDVQKMKRNSKFYSIIKKNQKWIRASKIMIHRKLKWKVDKPSSLWSSLAPDFVSKKEHVPTQSNWRHDLGVRLRSGTWR